MDCVLFAYLYLLSPSFSTVVSSRRGELVCVCVLARERTSAGGAPPVSSSGSLLMCSFPLEPQLSEDLLMGWQRGGKQRLLGVRLLLTLQERWSTALRAQHWASW